MNLKNNSFSLKVSNEDFVQRQKNVFDQLNNFENKLKIQEQSNMEVDRFKPIKKPHRSLSKHYKGKESIFKRPQDPLTKKYMRNVPDFKKNPHKWTKYTLDDVKDEDMSDKSNTKAALSFLNDLKKRNANLDTDEMQTNETSGKIVFKKVNKFSNNEKNESDNARPSFASSKMVMPEYVVGGKPTRARKSRETREKKPGAELKLNHLYDEEDE